MGKTKAKAVRKNNHTKKKVIHSNPVQDLDDQVYDEEDYEFYQNTNRNLEFLTNLPTESTT